MERPAGYTAFSANRLIAEGPLDAVIPKLHAWSRRHDAPPLVFEDQTGRPVDFDLRGSAEEALARVLPVSRPAGPGRPKLGVVSREISLLPRHWEWLEEQPNGASAAIRRLVEEARKREPENQRRRRATDALSRVLTALAGNLPHYEEATRALYAGDRARFEDLIGKWPADVRAYALRLAENAL
jgi:hypothetical protein